MNNVLILPEDGWKEVSTDSQGSFTLTSGGQHCIHTGQPSDLLVGHRYGKKPVQFTTVEGESVYVRVSRPCFAVGDVLSGVVTKWFALLSQSYSGASFSPVVVQNTDIISFNVIGLDTATTDRKLFDSSGSAEVRYRGSLDRIQLLDDAGSFRTVTGSGSINDGLQHYIELRLDVNGYDLWVDGVFVGRSNGAITTVTLDSISNGLPLGAVFGVTLGGYASWPMVSDAYTYNNSDTIGSNDLTFNDAPIAPTESDFIEVLV